LADAVKLRLDVRKLVVRIGQVTAEGDHTVTGFTEIFLIPRMSLNTSLARDSIFLPSNDKKNSLRGVE
jgi:hypothetical protein